MAIKRFQPGQSGNPKGRPPTVSLTRKLLGGDADQLVLKARDLALAGDVVALRLILERLDPVPRSTQPAVSIPGLREAANLSAKARLIIDAVGDGLVNPDAAASLLASLANVAKIIESDELAARIEALERSV